MNEETKMWESNQN